MCRFRFETGGETGRLRPDVQPAARVGLATVGADDLAVFLQPVVHALDGRPPDGGRPVGVAGRDDPAGLGDTAHLAQDLDGVADVLQDLVGVNDVEGGVGEGERESVTRRKGDVRDAALGGVLACSLEYVGNVDARGVPLRKVFGREVDRDGSRATTDVEDGHVGLEIGDEVRGGVLHSAPGVGPEHRRVVTMSIDRRLGHLVMKGQSSEYTCSANLSGAETAKLAVNTHLCFDRVKRRRVRRRI